MIRLSREVDYALVLLAQIARAQHPGAEVGSTEGAHPASTPPPLPEHPSARSLAQATGLPAPMVGKVLKTLARGGLLESRRGALGGYALALPPDEITIAGIVQVLEGPIGLTDCSPGSERSCDFEERCPVRGPVVRLNAVIRQALEDVTLTQIVSSGRPLPRPKGPERTVPVRA